MALVCKHLRQVVSYYSSLKNLLGKIIWGFLENDVDVYTHSLKMVNPHVNFLSLYICFDILESSYKQFTKGFNLMYDADLISRQTTYNQA